MYPLFFFSLSSFCKAFFTLFFFEMEFHSCHPDLSEMVQSQLTATLPPVFKQFFHLSLSSKLGLQACATIPG